MHHLITNPFSDWDHLFAGATLFAVTAHAVNTFPTPGNKYGAWLLGCIQYAVGQRIAAANTFQGKQTQAIGTGGWSTPAPK